MSVRFLLAILACVVLQSCTCRSAPPLQAGKTNVLLVVIDTLRADHVSSYGYEIPTTPTLDRLAAEGVRFDKAFASSSWTRPGMAALLTGRYARETGVYEERYDRLPDDVVTMAERLDDAGYLTLGVTANPNINGWFGFDQGFDEYGDSGKVWRWMARKGAGKPLRGSREVENAEEINARSLELVDEHIDTMRGEPWFLQVLYIDPHAPYEPPREHVRTMRDAGARGLSLHYDAEIHYTDQVFGTFLAQLEERGLMENTLVIVTSDHGEGLDSYPEIPMSDRHGDTVYDGMTRVPLILQHPSLSPRVVDHLAGGIDVLPTLMDLLGLDVGETSGASLAPVVKGTGPADHPGYVISETDWQVSNKVGIRTATHHYIDNLDSRAFLKDGTFEGTELKRVQKRFLEVTPPTELYAVPVGEIEPAVSGLVADDPELERLSTILSDWVESTPLRTPIGRSKEDVFTLGSGEVVPAVVGDENARDDISSDMAAQLRALGYLDDGLDDHDHGDGDEGGEEDTEAPEDTESPDE